MNHVFDMKINPYLGNAEIQFDGQTVSSQSQLRSCMTDNFFNWYRKLPGMLYAEVNDYYELRVECIDVQFLILKSIFADNMQCKNIFFKPFKSRYSINQRIGWMCDAANELGIKLPKIPKYSIKSTGEIKSIVTKIISGLNPDYCKHYMPIDGVINIWVSSVITYKQCLKESMSTDDLVIVIDKLYSEVQVRIETCVVLFISENELPYFVEQWVNLMILAPYLAYGYDCLIHSNKAMSFECEAKTKMLIGELPIIKSKMPDRVECGNLINIDIQEFPQSALTLQISDNSVLRQKGLQLKAERPGMARVDIVSEQGVVLLSQAITVFSINRVTDIDLSLPSGSNVLIGDTFNVMSQWKPINAVNLNKAVWSSSPSGILRNIGGGKFEAVAPGKCMVTLTIEKVKKSISISVVSLPNDIKMNTEIKAKLNKTTPKFSASLLPIGSACKTMDIRVIDSNIATWDQNAQEVIPVAEGITELVVSAYDAKGQIVIQKKCKVEILPEKDIITPSTIPTLMFVCMVIAILAFNSEIFVWCILGGFGLSIVEIVLNAMPYIRKKPIKRNLYELIAGTISVIGFGCIMAWYFGLFG